MQQKIAELDQALGHKQKQIACYEKFSGLAGEEVGQDLKKSTILQLHNCQLLK